jgi:hypothetical protein
MGSERWMKMEELNGYTPPASLNLSDFQDAIGDAVVQAIIKIGIRVNREELLKALKYDRGQYKAGYDAGFADGFIETLHTVRCRDCGHLVNAAVNANGFLICGVSDMEVAPEDFCSHGERRKSNENHT